MIEGLAFHHLGVACRDLDREAAGYAPLGYRAEGPDFEDPIQGVRGRFLVGGGPRLELLVDLAEHRTIAPFLEAGVKVYHQAFEAPDFDRAWALLTGEHRARVARGPAPAVAFGGRRVAFAFLRNRALVELIEGE